MAKKLVRIETGWKFFNQWNCGADFWAINHVPSATFTDLSSGQLSAILQELISRLIRTLSKLRDGEIELGTNPS